MKVPFVDLAAQYEQIREQAEPEILEILRTGAYIGGEPVSRFERNFARYCGTKHAIGVGNGTDALQLALLALGIGRSDEVVTVSQTFFATVEAILHVGATPRFVDCDAETASMDPALLSSVINERTKAIIAVHLYGRPADMDAINAIADAYGLPVIEDAAQAQGAMYKGRRVGSLGDIACFSFYPSKNLGAAGDAGAITTNNDEYASTIRLLSSHGARDKYTHEIVGYNSRLDPIQAVVLDAKLKLLDGWNARRRALAEEYQRLLAGISEIRLPAVDSDEFQGIHHLFPIRVGNRDAVIAQLAEDGIAAGVHYPVGVHRQPALHNVRGAAQLDLPNTVDWADNELSLPMFETMTLDQVRVTCEAVIKSAVALAYA